MLQKVMYNLELYPDESDTYESCISARIEECKLILQQEKLKDQLVNIESDPIMIRQHSEEIKFLERIYKKVISSKTYISNTVN